MPQPSYSNQVASTILVFRSTNMALLRRRLPLVLGPLVLGFGFHVARQQLVANDGNSGTLTLLNPAQVSARLRSHEESFLVERGNGVLRYDSAQLASNNPVEDDHSERAVSVPLVTPNDVEFSTDWNFWGIYDGHGGWSTSAKLRESLIPCVVGELNRIYPPVAPTSARRLEPSSPEMIDTAVMQAFRKLDHDITNRSIEQLLANPSKKAAIEKLPPALSGSCALLAFYDSSSRDLRVALTGDSRAVLGVRTPGGQWQARSLSTDQTGSNSDEVQRIRSEHPQGEHDTCIKRGRVLGIYEPTRSFGDATVKWSRQIQQRLSELFFSRRVPTYLRTPPYMTAEPVITRTKLDPKTRPCFLVLASDGLFEMLSNDQVVGLVVDWLDQKRPSSLEAVLSNPATNPGPSDRLGRLGSWFSRSKPKSRVGEPIEDVSENKDSMKQPIRPPSTTMDGRTLKATVQDSNAATHLIRNALGGADQEQVSMLVSIPSPMSRDYRDDLTVTVVFFGDRDDADVTGKVHLNPEASRAKL